MHTDVNDRLHDRKIIFIIRVIEKQSFSYSYIHTFLHVGIAKTNEDEYLFKIGFIFLEGH